MPRGGARARSGPAPQPNALRRDRADDAEWTTLPFEGYTGPVPELPLIKPRPTERRLWDQLWARPQAVMWARLRLDMQVAAYVRAYYESSLPEASAGLKTAVLRMEGELGISVPGMHSLRWKIAEDEVSARREEKTAPVSTRPSAKARARALNAVGT